MGLSPNHFERQYQCLHPQQPNDNQKQPYNGYQKPDGYYHQNGNK